MSKSVFEISPNTQQFITKSQLHSGENTVALLQTTFLLR